MKEHSKEILVTLILLLVLVATLILMKPVDASANMQWFDFTYSFDRAQVRLSDGSVVSGQCDGWKDYENSDQIQVVIDGTTYYVHHGNATLIDGK